MCVWYRARTYVLDTWCIYIPTLVYRYTPLSKRYGLPVGHLVVVSVLLCFDCNKRLYGESRFLGVAEHKWYLEGFNGPLFNGGVGLSPLLSFGRRDPKINAAALASSDKCVY